MTGDTLAEQIRAAAMILELATKLSGRDPDHPERGLWSATGLRDFASFLDAPIPDDDDENEDTDGPGIVTDEPLEVPA